MPDDIFDFNHLDTDSFATSRDADRTLDELEKTFARLEKILLRNVGNLGAINKIIGGKTSKKRVLGQTILRAAGLFGGRGGGIASAFTAQESSNRSGNNRFPSSSGQSLGDLAGAIQRIIGRNL